MSSTTSPSNYPLTGDVALLPEGAADASDSLPTARGHVLHVINGQHYSGAERVQDLLALRLPHHGYRVSLACLKPDKFPEARMCQDTPLFETRMRSRLDFRAVKRLAKLVDSEQITLLHAHTPRTVMLASQVSRITGVPLVYHVHSPTSNDSTRRFQNWVNQWVERRSLRRVDRLITVSQSLRKHMVQLGFDPNIIKVVPNGVPVSNQRRTSELPASTWTLGTVALFRPRKGTEMLLRAMANLVGQHRQIHLLAVGGFETDDYERSLKKLARDLSIEEHVTWTGFCRMVDAKLPAMDLFVLPSLFGEGLPMVVLEAMAAGLPVIGTEVEGVPEAVRNNEDGLLVGPGDPAALAEAIDQFISGQVDWSTMHRTVIQRQAEVFSDDAMASGVARVYDQLNDTTEG